jgi:hypothetical protein
MYPSYEILQSLLKNEKFEIIDKLYENVNFISMLKKEIQIKNTKEEIDNFKKLFEKMKSEIMEDLRILKLSKDWELTKGSGIVPKNQKYDSIEYEKKINKWNVIKNKAQDLIMYDSTIVLNLFKSDYDFSVL